jgi:hypothetical protein
MAVAKKPFSLDLPDDMRTLVEDGAECVAVEFHESDTSASGTVDCAERCEGEIGSVGCVGAGNYVL